MTKEENKVWKELEKLGWSNKPEDMHLEYFKDIIKATKKALVIGGVGSSNVVIAKNTTNKHLTNGKSYQIHHNSVSETSIWIRNDIGKIACYSKKNFK